MANLWLDPASPIRQEAIQALRVSTVFEERLIIRALHNAFDQITEEKLAEFVQKEHIKLGRPSSKTVLHIGAGNVFTSWLHGAVITLMLGHRLWVKPSTQEPAFAHLWQGSLRKMDEALASHVTIVPWSEELIPKVDAIVAYGSDETLAELRTLVGPKKIFVGYGHKISAAVVFKEAYENISWPMWRQAIIEDSELFQLNGCLSPQMIFVEGGKTGPWNELALALKPAPKFISFQKLDEVEKAFEPFKGHLSCIGVAGKFRQLEPIRATLEACGATRFCELGEMQHPPLSWRNGGLFLPNVLNSISHG